MARRIFVNLKNAKAGKEDSIIPQTFIPELKDLVRNAEWAYWDYLSLYKTGKHPWPIIKIENTTNHNRTFKILDKIKKETTCEIYIRDGLHDEWRLYNRKYETTRIYYGNKSKANANV